MGCVAFQWIHWSALAPSSKNSRQDARTSPAMNYCNCDKRALVRYICNQIFPDGLKTQPTCGQIRPFMALLGKTREGA